MVVLRNCQRSTDARLLSDVRIGEAYYRYRSGNRIIIDKGSTSARQRGRLPHRLLSSQNPFFYHLLV
jgi:hypothetical protein